MCYLILFTANNSPWSSTGPAGAEGLLQSHGTQPQHVLLKPHTGPHSAPHTLFCLTSTDSHPPGTGGTFHLPQTLSATNCCHSRVSVELCSLIPRLLAEPQAGAGPRSSSTLLLSWDEPPAEHQPCIMTSACCYIIFFPSAVHTEDDGLQFASQLPFLHGVSAHWLMWGF